MKLKQSKIRKKRISHNVKTSSSTHFVAHGAVPCSADRGHPAAQVQGPTEGLLLTSETCSGVFNEVSGLPPMIKVA